MLIKSVANVKLRGGLQVLWKAGFTFNKQNNLKWTIWKSATPSSNFRKEKSQVQRWVSMRDLRSILNFVWQERVELYSPLGFLLF